MWGQVAVQVGDEVEVDGEEEDGCAAELCARLIISEAKRICRCERTCNSWQFAPH